MAPPSAPPTVLDRTVASETRRPDPRHGPSKIARWSVAQSLALGIGVTVVRYWFAADRRVFHVVADEPGQLAMARWLSGGTRWTMLNHSTWRPGYSLVLAPAYWLFDGGADLVRASLALNAALAGLSAVLLARLLQRWTSGWTELSRWSIALIAATVAIAPAAIASSAYTWAEAMVTCTFLTTLWWAQRFADTGRLAHALTAVLAATAAMTTHGRSLALLPTIVVIGAGVLTVRRRWSAATLVVVSGTLLGLLSITFTHWVQDAVWDDPNDVNASGAVLRRLDAPAALLDSFIGQSWYQLVASLGMVGVGVSLVVGSWWRPLDRLDRRSAALLIAVTTPLVLTSVTFMAERHRSDQLIYGRYVDAVIWPFVALGLAATWRLVRAGRDARPRTHRTILCIAAVTAVFGLIVALRHGDQLAGDVGLRMMVPGLLPYIGSGDGVPVVSITAVAVAALACFAGLARLSERTRPADRTMAVATVVLLTFGLAWSGNRVHDAQAGALNRWDISTEIARVDELLPDGERVGAVVVEDRDDPVVPYERQRQRYQIYQLYLPHHEMVWERTPGRFSTEFVFAPAGTSALVDAGARIVWRDPAVRMALWQLTGREPTNRAPLPSPG